MKPLRIAMVSHTYPYLEGTHAGQFVHELASKLVKLGHEVCSVVPAPSQESTTVMDGVQLEFYTAYDKVSYGHANNQYIRTPKFSVAFSMLRAVSKLRKVVKDYDIDIIHAHWAVPMGFVGSIVKLMTKTPLVITTHGRDVCIDPEVGDILPTLWYIRPLLRFALQNADYIIAASRSCSLQAIQAGAFSDTTVVINNGVDIERFSRKEVDPVEIQRKLKVEGTARIIMFVGSLAWRKGVDVLIRAMPHILESQPSATAVIIGDGTEREDLLNLRDLLGLHDKVIFVGPVSNKKLADYENVCEAFVLPSRREPFGIAAVEAMACAKPVIGTSVGGLQEVLDDGVTGLLVEPDDPKQLAEAILHVFQDKSYAQLLGNNARQKVEANFDWVEVARQTVSVYREAIGEAKV